MNILDRLRAWWRTVVVSDDPWYGWADQALDHASECPCQLKPYCRAHRRQECLDHEHTTTVRHS